MFDDLVSPSLSPLERLYLAALRVADFGLATTLEQAIDAEQSARELAQSTRGLGGYARWYAEQGVPVFPVRPRAKVPLLGRAHPAEVSCRGECGRPGHGLYDATTDPEQVARWWATTPDANIGTRTGVRFDVLDVDGPVGVASLLDLVARAASGEVVLPEIVGVASTPRNGGLHVYVPPTGAGNSSDGTRHLDYRGEGGYVLLPQSVTDTHGPGRRYRWVSPLALDRIPAREASA